MILNVFTIIELFIGFLTVVVMSWAGMQALVLGLRWRRSSTAEARAQIEHRSHLVLLLAVIALGIRLLNWPFFYATLQSLIPDIDGAMCIFGTTQIERNLTLIAEMLKPISFFLIPAWLVIHWADEKTETLPLMCRKLIMLSVIAAVVVAEGLIDSVLMFRIAPGSPVTCCTTVTDVLDRPTAIVPQALVGPQYSSLLSYAYYGGNASLIAALVVIDRAITKGGLQRWRRPAGAILFLCAIMNAGIFLLTQIEVHAPVIMHLPYHRCVYCLWQYVPDTVLMYTFFVLATASTGWAFMLDLVGRTGETEAIVRTYLKRLYELSIFCFAASMIMNTVHVTMA